MRLQSGNIVGPSLLKIFVNRKFGQKSDGIFNRKRFVPKKYSSNGVYRILKLNSNKISVTDVVVVSPPFYTYRKNWTKEIRSVADSSWFSNRSKITNSNFYRRSNKNKFHRMKSFLEFFNFEIFILRVPNSAKFFDSLSVAI